MADYIISLQGNQRSAYLKNKEKNNKNKVNNNLNIVKK